MSRLILGLSECRSTIDRWMAERLRRRGWIVFWLDEPSRVCRTICWMNEYEQYRRRAPDGSEG